MTQQILLDPLIPLMLLYALGFVSLCALGFAVYRGLAGWVLRSLAAIALLIGIANPSLQSEDRTPLTDMVLAVVDGSASQALSDREGQTAQALEDLRDAIAARPNTELREIPVGDGEGDAGTLGLSALRQALSEEPRARVAGAILITDGQVHDLESAPDLPAPLHVWLTGRTGDWDRRLIVKNAPAFAILGEEIELTLRVEDQGAAPDVDQVPLEIAVDGGEPQRFFVPVNEDLRLPVTLPHGGRNVIQFTTPTEETELTDRNNAAIVQINGVRDRLRVLLVSGEPHAGERTWRNLLKSDGSVDLVHFTILRPPEKQDGVPVDELSLIAFPTRELFLEKVDEFDLIIFDRYKRRGILPAIYIDSIRQYVVDGGAVLIAAGPDFASADSLYRSPLGEVLPGAPTARVYERGFQPLVTDVGHKHPVTEGLMLPEAETPPWGRWFRQIELDVTGGDVVMSGLEDRPLLILDRVGEGRVALLGSDHAWLWSRGYEGGGPQLELLRRLAHWMMKEPELEEEALWAEAIGQEMRIIRRSLEEADRTVTLTLPDGTTQEVELEEVSPGRFEAQLTGEEIGLYRLADGDKEAVIALGPAAPKEFEETIASGDKLAPLTEVRQGGIFALEEGAPVIRTVREGRVASGRNWAGITPRGAYETASVSVIPLVPAWLFLLLASALVIGAWLREGRT
ncbi:MAG: hypothetical protein AAGD04_13780 [Pseudomonadota bacterium]